MASILTPGLSVGVREGGNRAALRHTRKLRSTCLFSCLPSLRAACTRIPFRAKHQAPGGADRISIASRTWAPAVIPPVKTLFAPRHVGRTRAKPRTCGHPAPSG